MAEASDDCTCWRATSETGESHAAAWLGMHERIAVITRDGQRVEGRPGGPVWFHAEDGPEGEVRLAGLDVEMDDGSDIAIPLSEVLSIAPLLPPDPLKIIESVARALRDPFHIENGEVGWTAMAGPHDTVQIEVTVRREACRPTSPTTPRFPIEVADPPSR